MDYIAYYPFSGNANDVSENGYHGIVSPGVRLVADMNGIENSAYNFSNYGDRIFIGEEDLFSTRNQASISFWMHPRNGGFPVQPIFYNNQVEIIYDTDRRVIQFTVYSIVGGLSLTSELNSIPADKWSFIVCTYDGVDSKIYLNCKLIASFTLPDIDFNMPLEKTYLGSGGDTNDDLLTFYGDLDEVRIFDRGISDGEANELFVLGINQPYETIEFLAFGHPDETGEALISTSIGKVFLEVKCNTDLSSLTPVFQLPDDIVAYANGTRQYSGVSVNDFTTPVNYILTNEGLCLHQVWEVNITRQVFTDQQIEEVTNLEDFTIASQKEPTKVENNLFSIEVPCQTDLTHLIPFFVVSENAEVFVNDQNQRSGLTPQNFQNPVTYHVQDEHGCYSKDWIVHIKKRMVSHQKDSIPNVITVNSDFKNDYFILPDYYQGSRLTLINRLGKQVYHNLDYQNNFQGGNLSSGVYYLLIQNECFTKPYTGTLTILR